MMCSHYLAATVFETLLKYLTFVSLSWSSSVAFYKTATYLVVRTLSVADLSHLAWAETHGGMPARKNTIAEMGLMADE